MAKFRKKPVVIEAVQFEGENWHAIKEFVGEQAGYDGKRHYIRTLEGKMQIIPGDWIIRGVKGEFYPCKPNIFAATYELA